MTSVLPFPLYDSYHSATLAMEQVFAIGIMKHLRTKCIMLGNMEAEYHRRLRREAQRTRRAAQDDSERDNAPQKKKHVPEWVWLHTAGIFRALLTS